MKILVFPRFKVISSIIILILTTLLFTCQKENAFLTAEENTSQQEQNKTYQSYLKAKEMPLVLDFINVETNYTRQVVVDRSGVKKAKQDYRTSGISARTDNETSFGYIDTSNALVVESDNFVSYTFKVVTKDMTYFINYIVVEDKTTLDKYGYFMRYTPTSEWIENKLSLSFFSGTIEYYNDDEVLQTTLTLSEGTITGFGVDLIPCPEIVFNPNSETQDEGTSDDSSGSSGTTSDTSVGDDGVTTYYNPWQFFWTGWVSSGGGGGGDGEGEYNQEITNEGSSGGECCDTCEAAPGVECSHEHHNYTYNRTGQINLKSEPSSDNPCVFTGVVAFLIEQAGFTQEEVDWLADIEQEFVYAEVINYLNVYNYSQEAVAFVQEAIDVLKDNNQDGEPDGEVDFENEIIKDSSFVGTVAECVLDELIATGNNIFKAVSEAFTDNNSEFRIIFSVQESPQNAPAHTSLPDDAGIINIKIDPDYVNGNSIDLANIILHEVIHAELHRIFVSNNQGPNSFPTQQYDWYIKLWEFYNNGNQNDTASAAEHNYMAAYLINNIALGLQEFDENAQTLDYYKGFAWTGLSIYGINAGYITQEEFNNFTNLSYQVYIDNHTNNCDN